MDCTSRFSLTYHNCILTSSSQLKCWGEGNNGRLGYGDASDRGNSANEMSDYLPFVNVNSNVQSIHVYRTHNCVHLSPSFDVKCWGYDAYGQLGYGDNQDRGDEAREMGTYLSTINFGPGVFVSASIRRFPHCFWRASSLLASSKPRLFPLIMNERNKNK